jgi:uncharacterized SAM-binding protein YcdF (DUF218 family)
MTAASVRRSKLRQIILWVVIAVGLAILGFIAVSAIRIVREADLQQTKHADAIVVFGAAEYSGRPSPVYRARLDHAFELYEAGLSGLVITTGGSGEDPKFSEGGVGRDYLIRRGIPEDHLIAETQGSDTAQSASRVGVILRTNGLKTCIAVSDEYHVFRIQKLLEQEGVRVYVAPRPGSRPRSRWQRFVAVLREAVSYTAWRMHIPT